MRSVPQATGEAERSPFGPYPEKLPPNLAIRLPPGEDLKKVCRRWQIRDMAIYGHVLEEHPGDGVPIELMIAFWRPGKWVLSDIARIETELAAMFGRPVQLIEKAAVHVSENPVLRQRIFRSIKTLFLDG